MKKEDFIALLKGMGLPAAHIKWVEENWDKADAKPDQQTMLADFNASQRSLYENDAEMMRTYDGKAKGRYMDIAQRAVVKAFALTTEETKDKTFEEVVGIAQSKATANANKSVETLQQENLTLSNQLKEVREVEIPKIRSEIDNEKKQLRLDKDFDTFAQDIVKDITAKNPKDVRVPYETAVKTAKILLREQYEFDYDKENNFVLLNKETKLKAKTADGTGFLGGKDVIMNVWKENQYIAESNADNKEIDPKTGKPKVVTTPAAGHNTQGGDDDEKQRELEEKYPHLKRAREHAEKIKADREAKEAEAKK